MTAEDDSVAVEAESEGMHVSGVMYQNFYHFLFIFKDGKVLLLKEYMDTEKVTDVLCGGHRPSDSLEEDYIKVNYENFDCWRYWFNRR